MNLKNLENHYIFPQNMEAGVEPSFKYEPTPNKPTSEQQHKKMIELVGKAIDKTILKCKEDKNNK